MDGQREGPKQDIKLPTEGTVGPGQDRKLPLLVAQKVVMEGILL